MCLLLAFPLAFALISCSDSTQKPPDSHVWVEISCEGLTAEDLRSQLLMLRDDLTLAVINDAIAAVYFYASEEEVKTVLDKYSDSFAQEIQIGEIKTGKGVIPAAPEQKEIGTIEFVADREKIESYGIQISNAAALISAQIPAPGSNIVPDPEAIASQPVRLPDGSTVSIGELGIIKPVSVYRPLLIQR